MSDPAPKFVISYNPHLDSEFKYSLYINASY